MAAVYTEHTAHRPLSICLDVPPSSSPFPSPSSSFLPPPMPGNHEFAIRPPPPGRASRKGSAMPNNDDDDENKTPDELPMQSFGETEDESEPLPIQSFGQREEPPAESVEADDEEDLPPTEPCTPILPPPSTISIPSPLPSPSTNAPTPNRPAPPSPAVSRRVSAISTASNRSRTPSASASVSRTASVRYSANTLALSTPSVTASLTSTTPKVLIYVRDFAFPHDDDRFHGRGPSVPKANHLAVLHQKLAGIPDDEDEDNDTSTSTGAADDQGNVNAAWDLLRRGWRGVGFGSAGASAVNGWGTSGASSASASGSGPSQAEMDLNFTSADDDTEAEVDDGEEGEGEEEEEEEPLYPGLYRALYAFEPEGTAEMALHEDQIVRVIGRGGGVGWAVVLVDSIDREPQPSDDPNKKQHALVPESYLEPVRLDWEDDEEAEVAAASSSS